MLAAEQLEFAVELDVAQMGFGFVGALVGPAEQALAGHRIQASERIGEEQLGVVVVQAVVVGRLQLPRSSPS